MTRHWRRMRRECGSGALVVRFAALECVRSATRACLRAQGQPTAAHWRAPPAAPTRRNREPRLRIVNCAAPHREFWARSGRGGAEERDVTRRRPPKNAGVGQGAPRGRGSSDVWMCEKRHFGLSAIAAPSQGGGWRRRRRGRARPTRQPSNVAARAAGAFYMP